MIYVLYGTEEYLMSKEVDTIIRSKQIDPLGIVHYSLENTVLEDVIEDASMPCLFSEYKMIVCENAYIFTGSTKKGLPEQNISLLETYMKNPNEQTILVFKTSSEKLDERKKIVKQIKKEHTVKELNGIGNINAFVEGLFTGYQIDRGTIALFMKRVGDNLLLLENEAEKIKVYAYEEKTIDKEDVRALTNKTIDLNIFTFIDAIIGKRKAEAMETYEELIKLNEEPIAIVVMLSNQFRIMYQAKELIKQGYTEKGIAETLDIHPYRVKKALEKGIHYSSEVLLQYLHKLGDIDFQIKSGKVDKYIALELFILGMK